MNESFVDEIIETCKGLYLYLISTRDLELLDHIHHEIVNLIQSESNHSFGYDVALELDSLLTLLVNIITNIPDRLNDKGVQTFFNDRVDEILHEWRGYINFNELDYTLVVCDQIESFGNYKIFGPEVYEDVLISGRHTLILKNSLSSLHALSKSDYLGPKLIESNEKSNIIYHFDGELNLKFIPLISWDSIDVIIFNSLHDQSRILNEFPFIRRFVSSIYIIDSAAPIHNQYVKIKSKIKCEYYKRIIQALNDYHDLTIIYSKELIDSCLPNAFFVGPGKSGTTSMFNYLKRHTAIFGSKIKEYNFFPALYGTYHYSPLQPLSLKSYIEAFADGVDYQYRIDVSPVYSLDFSISSLCIKLLCPHAKIVITLRNPFEVFYSGYKMMVREKRENRSFLDAAVSNQKLIPFLSHKLYHNSQKGLRAEFVLQYFKLFSTTPPLVIIYDDFLVDNKNTLNQIQDYLGLKKEDIHDGVMYHINPENADSTSHSDDGRMSTYQAKIGESKHKVQWFEQDEYREIYEYLKEIWRDDVIKTSQIIKRDLSAWLS